MTSRSLKSHPTTRRSTLRILSDSVGQVFNLPAFAGQVGNLPHVGLLSLAIVCGGAAVSEAGVRDLFPKSNSASPSAKSGVPAASSRSSTAISKLAGKRKPNQLIAQADEPLNRLKQRDAEQR